MTTISATTILRSINSSRPDKVLSTLLLRYPRWIHAEFMTHRQLSRNAASSRAIPVKKLIEDVMRDPAIPLWWGKNVPGMQAPEQLTGEDLSSVKELWEAACDEALHIAQAMSEHGAHKQLVNRLLEPFSHITVLVSATEWSNFLALRDHKDAEPHIAMLAREIRKELDRTDNIQTLHPNDWHLPFVTDFDKEFAYEATGGDRPTIIDAMLKLSVARCASTSYKTVDGFDMTLERAIQVYDKLVGSAPIHASPCEHVAQADTWGSLEGSNAYAYWNWHNPKQHGNFVGFRQHRKMLPNECL